MQRHDLAYLHPDAALEFPCRMPDPTTRALIGHWIRQGRPLVVARQAEASPGTAGGVLGAAAGGVLLGLTLPTSADRQRISCRVAPEALRRIAPPLPLAHCLHRLPAPVASGLEPLIEGLAALGITARCYGSLAWETLSGESYRHPDSDVDLILELAHLPQARAALALLAHTSATLPCRLDGELRFPDGQAVAWRELADALAHPGTDRPVLLKGTQRVQLQPAQAWLASFSLAPTPEDMPHA